MAAHAITLDISYRSRCNIQARNSVVSRFSAELWMSDDKDGSGRLQNDRKRPAQRLWIERSKTFIKNNHVRSLKERPGDIETTLLAVAELPAGFPHDLLQSPRHAIEERAEIEGTTNLLGLF